MARSIRFLTLLVVALVWIQTASAWHEAEHALHGHDVEEIACEIFDGTAEQPASTGHRVVIGGQASDVDSKEFHEVDILDAGASRYRSRAPPALL